MPEAALPTLVHVPKAQATIQPQVAADRNAAVAAWHASCQFLICRRRPARHARPDMVRAESRFHQWVDRLEV
jgi:hypothetical protein